MREILFRGKRVDNGEWVYGSLLTPPQEGFLDLYEISDTNTVDGDRVQVYPETVGEYIGLTDKNGNKIFEGDITTNSLGDIGVIEYKARNAAFIAKELENGYWLWFQNVKEVIGNIHDNPELLEVE